MKALCVVLVLLFVVNLSAQDLHFSQVDANKVNMNPGFVGSGTGNYRMSGGYKSQWGSVSVPTSLFAMNYDMNVWMKDKQSGIGEVGFGIGFFTDKSGSAALSSNNINLSTSITNYLSSSTTLTLGVQGGFTSQSINLQELTWDTQFQNHQFDSELPSQETFINVSNSYLDVNSGLVLSKKDGAVRYDIGVAAFHLNSPKRGVFSSRVLPQRYVGHATLVISVGDDQRPRELLPKVYYAMQGAHSEMIVGAGYRMFFQQESKYTKHANRSFVEFGAYTRVNDAFILSANVEFSRFNFGLSYDVNYSDLRPAAKSRGGMEFSLTYNGIFSDPRISIR